MQTQLDPENSAADEFKHPIMLDTSCVIHVNVYNDASSTKYIHSENEKQKECIYQIVTEKWTLGLIQP